MIADDKRSVTLVLTLLASLIATCYLAWFTYSLEQDHTRRALISAATRVSVAVEHRLQSLTALPAVAAQLPVTAIEDLRALLPFVISSEPAADHAAPEPPLERSLEEGTARIGPVIPALSSEGSASGTAIIYSRRENRLHLTTVNITNLLNELMQPFAQEDIEISFYDLNQFSQDPFYRQRLSSQTATQAESQYVKEYNAGPNWLQALQFSSSVTVLGRDWMLRATPLGSFAQKTTTLMPLVVFICGCVISLLLAILIHQKNR